jgi:hypothetical protein
MGQLELQDCFAPYFDPKQEIEVKNAAPKRPAQSPRTKSAISMAAISRKAKPPQGATKPPSGNQQMK